MNQNINHLIEKYWAAEASSQEEQQIRTYFSNGDIAEEHMPYASLFGFYNHAAGHNTDLEIESIDFSDANADIEALLTKYESAETSLEEEKILGDYFSSNAVAEEHNDMKALFDFISYQRTQSSNIDIEAIIQSQDNDIDINALIDLYSEGESSLAQEATISEYLQSENVDDAHAYLIPLFQLYNNRKSLAADVDVAETLNNQTADAQSDNTPKPGKAKVMYLRRVISAVAAIFVLGFAAYSVMENAGSDTQYKGKYVQLDTEAETEEALEITREALAFLSKKMNKNTDTVKESVSKADAVQIFK